MISLRRLPLALLAAACSLSLASQASAQEVAAPASPAADAPAAQPAVPVDPAAPAAAPVETPVAQPVGDTTINPHPPVANGQTKSIDMEHEGKKRRYLLQIPAGYDPAVAAPVLFGFGGWHDSPENYSSYAHMWTTGAGREAIIVYPEGFERAWEAAPYAKTRDGEDIRFVQRILDTVDADYHVDRSRVYAMGMSNGGGFASVLGCHAQETFAAVAMVSAAYYNPVEINCVDAPMATLIMHGVDDKMMTYGGGDRHGAPYLPVQTIVDGYSNRNRCTGAAAGETDVYGTERVSFEGCLQELRLVNVRDDHTWFLHPDASAEVWDFLSRQRKELAPAPAEELDPQEQPAAQEEAQGAHAGQDAGPEA